MTMNFMDYADDMCMSMFTKEQATKMRSVLDRDIGQRMNLGTSKKVHPPSWLSCFSL